MNIYSVFDSNSKKYYENQYFGDKIIFLNMARLKIILCYLDVFEKNIKLCLFVV